MFETTVGNLGIQREGPEVGQHMMRSGTRKKGTTHTTPPQGSFAYVRHDQSEQT